MHKLGNTITKSSLFVLLMICFFTNTAANAYGISIGYRSNDTGLKTGMVAALDTEQIGEDNSYAVRADINTTGPILGVVSNLEKSLAVITSSEKKVFIESQGAVDVFVSDINGSIERGDQLVLSPLRGVLMKYGGSGDVLVIATANERVNDDTNQLFSVTTNSGLRETLVNTVNATLGISKGSVAKEKTSLEKLGESIFKREISNVRMMIVLIMFVIILVVEGSIIYGAVSSGVTAMGRNPFAKSIIRSELFRILVAAIVVLAIGFGSIYVTVTA